ncbi:unnamed protein product [Linum trigynum]|uniref:Gnk2-homologous domain-containing protein n=1 Tax=Linum trigynum TaxID=586398 RepID=A0AAV2GFB3_9ROSI
MGSFLRFLTVVFVIGTSIRDDFIVVANAADWGFSFPYNYCSNVPIEEWSGLGQTRTNILSDLVKLHWQPRYRSQPLTCIRETRDKATMWARVECLVDPATDTCNRCLIAAKNFMDGKCRYFTGGRIEEKHSTCKMLFADFDVCAS